MDEHRLAVTRSARYYTLGRPSPALREVWFVCHGYGQLAGRFLRHFDAVADNARLIVAPEGLSRFYLGSGTHRDAKVGASWMTREDRLTEIDDYTRYLDALYAEVFRQIERPAVRVTALGFSQGAATASRWAALGHSRVDHIVLWGGELPPDLDLGAVRDRLADVTFSLVYGEADEFITAKLAAATAARLAQHGIPHRVRPFAGGHELTAAALRELASA
ncbi:MAG TPA: dienelactone hydrolase family protein [Gemmatimonadales bacterium]|jgi:predicted esterase|nr:dienelactone hydrolase family protein [Gemmatimonadales bacterium]